MKDLTPKDLKNLLSLSAEKAEAMLFDYLQKMDAAERVSYGWKGILCLQAKKHLLHEQHTDPETGKPCSWTRWVRIACPWSYSTTFAAVRDVEALDGLADEDIAQIPASNFPTMRQLSSAVRKDPEVLKTAKTKRTADLVDHIREHHPDQHIEPRKAIRFYVEESAAEKINEALDKAEERGAGSRSEALEFIAATAMQAWEAEEA